MDEFYRNLSDAKLRAAYEIAKRNIASGFLGEGMEKEKDHILTIAKERGLDFDDDSLSSKIDTLKGYMEFF